MTAWCMVWFFAMGALFASGFWVWFYRPAIKRLWNTLEGETRHEAFEAARPCEVVRLRHVRANGIAWTGGCHKLDSIDELVRTWAQIEVTPIELDAGDLLQAELLIGEIDCVPLFAVHARPSRARP